jgi:hypothetical protein
VQFGDFKESKLTYSYFIVLHSIRVCVLQNRAVEYAEAVNCLSRGAKKKINSKSKLIKKTLTNYLQ